MPPWPSALPAPHVYTYLTPLAADFFAEGLAFTGDLPDFAGFLALDLAAIFYGWVGLEKPRRWLETQREMQIVTPRGCQRRERVRIADFGVRITAGSRQDRAGGRRDGVPLLFK